jgi:hypothetical protein
VSAAGPQLVCPFCRSIVVDGVEPRPGACVACGAQYAGGGDDARAGVAAALSWWQITDLDGSRVSDGLFRILPGDPLNRVVTVTSDRRDAFYRWWVFVAAGAAPAEVLAQAAARAP